MPMTSLPCLVFEYGDERPTKLYGASDGAYRPCEIGGSLLSKHNLVTAQGWVLTWDPESSATFLWDPQDPDDDGRVTLPALEQAPPAGSTCVLSRDPTSPQGCTVVISAPYGNLWYCHTGSAAPEWVKHSYLPEHGRRTSAPLLDHRRRNKMQISRLAPYRGKFYYAIGRNEYGVLEFSPWPALRTVKTTGVELTFPPSCVHASTFLLDLDGELHMVRIFFADLDMNAVTDVAVFKMGFQSSSSVSVKSIGDRAILASSACGFAGWCSASKFVLAPNSVYWLSHNGDRLHVFDVGTKTERVHKFESVAQLSRLPFWLLPAHRSGEL